MANITNNSLDLDINFDRNPLSGDVSVRKGEEAIKRALRNLVLLGANEKPFHPEIDSGIRNLLFELTDPVTIAEMKNRITEVIRRYEPRVAATIIDITDIIDRNEVRVAITFTIKNVPNIFTANVVMRRTR